VKRRAEKAVLDSRGLTLVEAIIALTVTALVVGILLSALRLGHRSEEKGLERQELSQRVRILSDRLSWLLRGAYPYFAGEKDEMVLYFSGSPDSVGFVTTSVDRTAGALEDRAGLKWVRIFAEEGRGLVTEEKVYFGKDVFESGGGRQYVLDPTVKKVEFQYLDVDEKEGVEEWVEEWDPENRKYLPSAVRVSIVLKEKEGEYLMPPVVASLRANLRPGGLDR